MQTPIRLFSGLSIGWVDEDSSGNKIVRDQSLKIVSRYDKASNWTTNEYGKKLTLGDTATGVLLLKYAGQL